MSLFPSIDHQSALRAKHKDYGLKSFSHDEMAHWFAYDYGFRHVLLSDKSRCSPIDREGINFDRDAVIEAIAYYRERFGQAA